MNRPRTSVNGKFEPGEWMKGREAEKTRPGVTKLLVQAPLFDGGPAPFTVFYEADGTLYRVDGTVPGGADAADAIAEALEHHWWKQSFKEATKRGAAKQSGS